jgi:hypothetical protein
MSDPNPSLVTQSQPFKEVFVDSFTELFIFLDLMIGLCEGTATCAAKGTERKPLFFSKGQVAGSHQEVGIAVDRLDRVATTTEVRDIGKVKVKFFGNLPGRDFII